MIYRCVTSVGLIPGVSARDGLDEIRASLPDLGSAAEEQLVGDMDVRVVDEGALRAPA